MLQELTLLIPNSLLFHLEKQAEEQGVSLEALCLSLLSGNKEEPLIDPEFYQSLSHDSMRKEVRKVMESALPNEEIRKRINRLEFFITKRYIR